MNIILLRKKGAVTTRRDLGPFQVAAVLLFSVLLFSPLAYVTGMLTASNGNSNPEHQAIASRLAEEVSGQKLALLKLEEEYRQNMNAMAMQLGSMQAQLTRINALGRQVTKTMKLDGGEFDFNAQVGIGGPQDSLKSQSMKRDEFETLLQAIERDMKSQEQQLGLLNSLLDEEQKFSQYMPQGKPTKSGWMSSSYGSRIDPFSGQKSHHAGVDFAGRGGSEILAVADGVVIWSGKRYGYGTMVEIDHGNGYRTRYAHNRENKVSLGEKVKKGQVIALMGKSGRATAPHVHFEVLLDNRKLDPRRFIYRQG